MKVDPALPFARATARPTPVEHARFAGQKSMHRDALAKAVRYRRPCTAFVLPDLAGCRAVYLMPSFSPGKSSRYRTFGRLACVVQCITLAPSRRAPAHQL